MVASARRGTFPKDSHPQPPVRNEPTLQTCAQELWTAEVQPEARGPKPGRDLLKFQGVCFVGGGEGQGEGGGVSRIPERCRRLRGALPGGAESWGGEDRGVCTGRGRERWRWGVERIGKGRSPATKTSEAGGCSKAPPPTSKVLVPRVQSPEFETQLRRSHARQGVSSTWASVSPYLG